MSKHTVSHDYTASNDELTVLKVSVWSAFLLWLRYEQTLGNGAMQVQQT